MVKSMVGVKTRLEMHSTRPHWMTNHKRQMHQLSLSFVDVSQTSGPGGFGSASVLVSATEV